MILEPFLPTAKQVVERRRSQAQRLALQYAADYEMLMAAAEKAGIMARMYQDRAERLGKQVEGKYMVPHGQDAR